MMIYIFLLIAFMAAVVLAAWYFKINGKKSLVRYISIGAVVVVLGAIGIMASIPPKLDVQADSFSTSGMYGITVPYNEVQSVELTDNIPKILNKTNGMDFFGFAFNGNFKVEGWGVCKLYMQKNEGPYVVVKYNEKYLIYSINDKVKTEEAYKNLKEAINK